jgi:hypothetical protein
MIVRGTGDLIKELIKIDNLLNKQFKETKKIINPREWDSFCQEVILTYLRVNMNPRNDFSEKCTIAFADAY